MRTSLLTLCSLLLLAQAALAQDAATENKLKDAPKFEADKAQPLFNGKDFSGWTSFSKDENAKLDDVRSVKEDGTIVDKGKPVGYLRTTKDYTNYVLRLEYRFPSKPGNGGVLLRVQEPDKVWPKSIEAQLQNKNAGDFWNIDEFKMTTDAARLKGRNTKKIHETNEKPLTEWNVYEIAVDGPTVTLKVNDLVQNQATDCEVIPGKIALQAEGSEMEFRNVMIMPLDEATPPKPSASAEGSSPKRLEGLDGWHIRGNGNWTYNDGVIEGKQTKAEKSYTHVVSDKSFKDFKASLKFKCLQGNSGFYFRVQPVDESKMLGIQAEIDEANNVGGLYESYGRNWLSLPDKETVAKYFKPQEWNEMTVEGHGPHVVVHVNGQKAGEINDPKIRMDGPFALQIHGGQDVHVMFKDIKLEEIK